MRLVDCLTVSSRGLKTLCKFEKCKKFAKILHRGKKIYTAICIFFCKFFCNFFCNFFLQLLLQLFLQLFLQLCFATFFTPLCKNSKELEVAMSLILQLLGTKKSPNTHAIVQHRYLFGIRLGTYLIPT